MALISLNKVCWGIDSQNLLEDITFQIEPGERICLLGRNGVGKSTLLKLLSGAMVPDAGEIRRAHGICIAALEQDVPPQGDGTIFEVVAGGFGQTGRALAEYDRLAAAAHPAPAMPARIDALQRLLDARGGWNLRQKIQQMLSRARLDSEAAFAHLSAGMKRRALFARAMAQAPDLLLLDEPTNHLDIDTIAWMEDFIPRHAGTLLFVTHDRMLLQRLATRVLELDRGLLFSYACDYHSYLQRKQAELQAEEKQNRVFDKKLSKEELWIRQGIKARRTRNEGRVRTLIKLREAFRARRRQTGTADIRIQDARRSGKLVIEAENIGFAHNRVSIVDSFSTLIMRGDKVGIIGPNGIGKTTLLNILLKRLSPQHGRVRHGTHLQAAYFDQLRDQLNTAQTVQENIAGGNDYIDFNGQRRHVIGYLRDFLFSPERCRTPVHVLSGGEKNRLLLAHLFARPANLLVLDEPTNDLDIDTLEMLEERLLDYAGTLLLVSHDRAFLNNVVTRTIAFEGDGRVAEYPGGYDDWQAQRPQAEPKAVDKPRRPQKKQRPDAGRTKLGYMQIRELADLPQRIEQLETEQKKLYAEMADPLFYQKDKADITAVQAHLQAIETNIETAYQRWETLENLQGHA